MVPYQTPKTQSNLTLQTNSLVVAVLAMVVVSSFYHFVAKSALVQEEIEFSLCPEMNASRLICQVMADNESILISGAEQFSKHTGYAFTLGYGGNYIDNNKDEIGNSKKQTCAIDACIFFNYKVPSQWKKTYIDREMIKAYAGFSSSPLTKIATGNW